MGGKLAAGAWHHLVVTSDGKRLRVWLDGVQLSAKASPSPFNTRPRRLPLVIGACDPKGTEQCPGAYDEVAVYSRVLGEADIVARIEAMGRKDLLEKVQAAASVKVPSAGSSPPTNKPEPKTTMAGPGKAPGEREPLFSPDGINVPPPEDDTGNHVMPADGIPTFLSLPASREFYGRVLQGDERAMGQLAQTARGSNLATERDEASLLLGLAMLKKRDLTGAAAAFEKLGDSAGGAVALAARRYAYLVKNCPGAALDGVSIVDHGKYVAACGMYATGEAARGQEQVAKAIKYGVLNLPQWQQAWWLLLDGKRCYERAAMLDPQRAAPAGEVSALNSALERLGGIGIELLRMEAEKQKEAIPPLLGMLRKDASGRWGTNAAVGRVNDAVETVLKTRRQMEEIRKEVPEASAAAAAMAAAIDRADRIDPPANLSAEGRKAFGELFPAAGNGMHRLKLIGRTN